MIAKQPDLNFQSDPHLLIIGGTGRNVGKTTLALEIITKFAHLFDLTGLKVSTHKKGEELFHGDHPNLSYDDFHIYIETSQVKSKDTARMLHAGAKNAFYIQTPDHQVSVAYTAFKSLSSKNNPIICESRSLRKHVKPGLFILLVDPLRLKENTAENIHLADYVHYSNENKPSFLSLINRINFNIHHGWYLI